MEMKKVTKKQYKWNIRLTLLFGVLVGLFLGVIFVYKVEINTINQALDSMSYCYEEYALKDLLETKCFQRILRHDRFIDIEENIIIHSSFYNTTWNEISCGKYDDYKLNEDKTAQ